MPSMPALRHLMWRSVLNSLAAAEVVRRPKPRCILVFGHMRSGSSVVNHALASHPDIFAVGERNASYSSVFDLHRLVAEVRFRNGLWTRKILFAADQVNHNRFLTWDGILVEPRVLPVFLVREPVATVTSIVRTLGPLYGGWDASQAVEYYVERLVELRRCVEIVSQTGKRPAVVDYDELVDHPKPVLQSLSASLGLTGILTPDYLIQEYTGQRGDPSPKIRSGCISRHEARPPVGISAVALEGAQAAYDEFREPSAVSNGNIEAAAGVSDHDHVG